MLVRGKGVARPAAPGCGPSKAASVNVVSTTYTTPPSEEYQPKPRSRSASGIRNKVSGR